MNEMNGMDPNQPRVRVVFCCINLTYLLLEKTATIKRFLGLQSVSILAHFKNACKFYLNNHSINQYDSIFQKYSYTVC